MERCEQGGDGWGEHAGDWRSEDGLEMTLEITCIQALIRSFGLMEYLF